MTATEQTVEVMDARPAVLVREFAADLTVGDGRTVDVRVIPFGERITHNDGLGGVARGVDYQEEWLPGVFDHQLKAADKILGNYEHIQGPQGLVARATRLVQESDGYHATFRMLNGSDADKTLELINEGVLDGISVEARPRNSSRSRDGVVQRIKADLRAVAFTRFPAFSGARVLAVREEADVIMVDQELFPAEMDPEVVERCRQLGIKLPQRYEAHPDDGHPGETGTPENGTRHIDTTTSEVARERTDTRGTEAPGAR